MKNEYRKELTWLLSGASFVLVIVSAGCHGRSDSVSSTSAAAPGAAGTPVFDSVAAPSTPSVNVFGEFDGVQPTPVKRTGGETGFQQHTFIEDGYDADVAVDPKGQWLVFSSTRNSEHGEIYTQKVDGMSVTQLTADGCDNAFPVFNADGTKIAFCSNRAGTWDIYTMDSDGKNVVQVTNSPMQEMHPTFSPDGGRLAYSAMGRSGQWEIWTVNLASGEKRMISYGLFPTWSPNREKDQIAFQKARARGSRWFSLWTLDLVDGEARRMTEVAVSANAAIVSPCWSPDGKHMTFATIVEPAHVVNEKPVGQQDVWTISDDGTNRHRITDGSGVSATPFWAADNRIYFISDRSGSECIWSARADVSGLSTAAADTKEMEH